MNRLFMRIPVLALLIASIVAMSGCTQSDEPMDSGEVTLRLHVAMGSRAGSRADLPPTFEGASGDFENISSLRVIVVRNINAAGTEGFVEVNKLVITSADGYPLYDNLQFKVADNETKRIYLIANEDALTPPVGTEYTTSRRYLDNALDSARTTPRDIKTLEDWVVSAPVAGHYFTTNFYANVAGAPGIPLTEWFDVDISELTSSNEPVENPDESDENGGTETPDPSVDDAGQMVVRDAEIVDVHLFMMRAAAKASFYLNVGEDFKASGVSIDGIRISPFCTEQYVFPRNATYVPEKEVVEPIDGTPLNITDRYISSFTARGTAQAGFQLTLDPVEIKACPETYMSTVYFPETILGAGQKFEVSVHLAGTPSTDWLPAQPLGQGPDNNIMTVNGNQAIARGTHVKILINFGGEGVTYTVAEAPYNSVTLKPDFGI